jgi:integrase
LFTGLRGSELCSIKVKQIGTKTKYGWVFNDSLTIDKNHMKGKKHARTMYLSNEVKDICKKYLIYEYKNFCDVDPTPERYFFPSLKSKDKPLLCSTWNEILKGILARNGIYDINRKLGTHSLRKTFVVDLYNNPELKSDPLLLIKCTGHQRVETLFSYVSVHTDDIKKAQMNVHSGLFECEVESEKEREVQRLKLLYDNGNTDDICFT